MLRGPARAKGTAAETVENISAQVLALQDAAQRKGLGRALAIGVAVPGPLNVRTGVIYAAPHVKAWRSFPLRRNLERVLGRTVIVENDANAWALGEYWRGAARGCTGVAQRLASRIHTEAFRVSRIIDDLLDLSRIESEEAPPREPVLVSLVALAS